MESSSSQASRATLPENTRADHSPELHSLKRIHSIRTRSATAALRLRLAPLLAAPVNAPAPDPNKLVADSVALLRRAPASGLTRIPSADSLCDRTTLLAVPPQTAPRSRTRLAPR